MTGKIIIPAVMVSLILLVSGCVQQPSGPVCNPPYIAKGYECCLDQNGNNICDSDEQQAIKCGDGICQSNEDCFLCPQDCGECEPTEYCGDGTCSPEEGVCRYDSDSDRYEKACPGDCGHDCPAKMVLSSDLSKSEETYSYDCSGYKEDVCNKTGDNKFMFLHETVPYKSVQRGIRTVIKNVGEEGVGTVNSSFECYAENRTVMDSDGDFYEGTPVKDYFYGDAEEVELISTLNPAYPPGTEGWYYYYYLHFDIRYMEDDFNLTCDITLTSEEPEWTNTQTIEISFLKD